MIDKIIKFTVNIFISIITLVGIVIVLILLTILLTMSIQFLIGMF